MADLFSGVDSLPSQRKAETSAEEEIKHEARERLTSEGWEPNRRKTGELIPNRYIVTLKEKPGIKDPAGGPSKVESLLSQFSIDPRNKPDTMIFKHAISGFAATLTDAQKRALEKDPSVEAVEQDRVVSRPNVKRSIMPQVGPRKELPTGVERIEGHLSPTANAPGGVDATIAIIDTGINERHPDLNVVHSKSFVPNHPSADDDDGHGSVVAAIAAARKDGHGTVGVAPGARLWNLKALDQDGNGSWSQIIAAVDYVTEHAKEIDVVNMSLSDTDPSVALDKAISRSVDAGVAYFVAAGNDARDAALETPSNHPRVLTISAISDGNGRGGGGADPTCEPDEKDDTFASFSNFGKNVRLAAPGVCIEAASKRQGDNVDTYEVMSGTSMAAPHGAGAGALIKAKNHKATPDSVYDTIIKNAKKQNDPVYGFSGDPDKYPEPLLNVRNF